MAQGEYQLRTEWLGKDVSASEVRQRFLRALDALSRAHPVFKNWTLGKLDEEEPEDIPLEDIRAEFTDFVETQDQSIPHEWDMFDPEEGYMLIAGASPTPDRERGELSFLVTEGTIWYDQAKLSVGGEYSPVDPELITYPIFKSALLALLPIWPAPWSYVRYSQAGVSFDRPPEAPYFPYSGYGMPWMAWLDAKSAAGLVLPPDMVTETTPDGGLLMIAAETRFDPDNPDHFRRSAVLAEIMMTRAEDIRAPTRNSEAGPSSP